MAAHLDNTSLISFLLELESTPTECFQPLSAKLLRLEGDVIVLSDGRLHTYAEVADGQRDLLRAHLLACRKQRRRRPERAVLLSTWLQIFHLEVRADLSISVHDFEIVERERQANEALLTSPYDYIGRSELNGDIDLLRAACSVCIGNLCFPLFPLYRICG
jgi:hypothetical protein